MDDKKTLAEIIKDVENFDDDSLIYAEKNTTWEMNSPASLIEVDRYAEDDPEPPDNMTYFISVGTAKEVLEVWRRWREGKRPTEKERFEAIVFYAENDAYIRDGL